jgi:hypothetical protein
MYCVHFIFIRDTIMDCTLWDSLSVEFMTSYNQRSDSGPIVMIIKHARVKEPQGYDTSNSFPNYQLCKYHHILTYIPHLGMCYISGVYPMQLTNVWNGTKLIFDTSVPEIKAFLTRYANESLQFVT